MIIEHIRRGANSFTTSARKKRKIRKLASYRPDGKDPFRISNSDKPNI